ncbi:MAG: pantetheine-phosphate adenylyltransferase [Candidatus Limimorpha sp.]
MRTAVFTGSFDPFTRGHEDIVLQALPLFDEIFIAIGENINKKYTFSIEDRINWIQNTFQSIEKVKIVCYEGLTVDLCKNLNANFIIRGLRNSTDFDYESVMADANKKLSPSVETVFFLSRPDLRCVSSSLVRDVIKCGGNPLDFVPEKSGFHV